jgi:hypothetical protein
LPLVKGAHEFLSTDLTHEKLRNSGRSCAKYHSFYTKCYLQMAYHGSDSMDDMKEVDLGPHPEAVDGVMLVASFIFRHSPSSLQGPRHGDFTLVDAEQPDNSRIITIIAGPEEAKIQLPRILICTMSPVIADMLQKALKQQKKKLGALEHVPRFERGRKHP